jgi:hypothetical protein
MRHLKAIVFDRRSTNWSLFLPIVQRIVNDNIHTALGTSPNNLIYGMPVRAARGLIEEPDKTSETAGKKGTNYLNQMKEYYDKTMRKSLTHLQATVNERKKLQKDNLKSDKIEVDEWVLISHPVQPPNKLASRWFGPRRVIKVHHNTYSLYDPSTKKINQYDITRLKKYNNARKYDEMQLMDLAARDRVEWLVDAIVDHRIKESNRKRLARKDYEFLVRWEGFGPDEDTWQDYETVKELEALDRYVSEHQRELRLFA